MLFCDLNLTHNDGDPHLARERVALAVQLGWGTVATAHAAADTLSDRDRHVRSTAFAHLIPRKFISSDFQPWPAAAEHGILSVHPTGLTRIHLRGGCY